MYATWDPDNHWGVPERQSCERGRVRCTPNERRAVDGQRRLIEAPERAHDPAIRDDTDPIDAWMRLRETKGRLVTVLDLYRLVAQPRGLEAHELPLEERRRLARAAIPVIWPGNEVTEGSERSDLIELVDYDEAWPRRFRRWRDRLSAALGSVARRIEHVGSTSVPGLQAKPIVDIQVSVTDMDVEDAYVPPLEAAGVQLRSRDSLHRYFRPFLGQVRDVHVHVCNVGSDWEREHLLFRDYLRRHPADAARYAEAKREAVRYWADDGWAYTDAKTEAVLHILDRAAAWAATEGWSP